MGQNHLTKRLRQDEAAFLVRKLEDHFSNLKAGAAANFINVVVTLLLFRQAFSTAGVIIVVSALAAIIGWRATLAARLPQIVEKPVRLRLLDMRVNRTAIMVGGFWGTLIGYLFHVATPIQSVFIGILGAGMMSAGTATFRTSKKAADLYVVSMVPGCLAGFTALSLPVGIAASGLLLSYILVLLRTSRIAADGFKTAFERELELQRSNETIKLLLHEYSEQGADCLFELDESGSFVKISDRLAELTGTSEQQLMGVRFSELFENGSGKAQLVRHLQARESFKELILSGQRLGRPFWWSVSAKPANDGRIAVRGVISDVTAQFQAEQQVSFLAHHDPLTQLPNRFRFNQMLASTLKSSRVTGVMFLDLDQFKSVNDTLGHPVGDKLLQVVATKLLACVSGDEFAARLGGDEFAIIVPQNRIDKIDEMSNQIIEALSAPIDLDGQAVIIGTSIGVALSSDGNLRSDELLRNADIALYSAKSDGRNRMKRFVAGMDEAAQNRRSLEIDLRTALGNGEMVLHYQPLIDVQSGETTGHEALLRWEHPVRGRVMPDVFIPISEETGLIVQLGEWVIRQAISDVAQWPEAMTVSINLSAAQMRSPTLISTLMNALATNQVVASRICFEITETVLMNDNEANIEILHKLRNLGVQIALDDFGTGYSSLNYLRSFPFTKIKIDRCFLNEIEEREDCQAIVRSVVHLARNLGMATTAEGVERADQMELLRAEGCTEAQGFLFSKAVPIADLPDMSQIAIVTAADPTPLGKPGKINRKRAA